MWKDLCDIIQIPGTSFPLSVNTIHEDLDTYLTQALLGVAKLYPSKLWGLLLVQYLPVGADLCRGESDSSGQRAKTEWGACAVNPNRPEVQENWSVTKETPIALELQGPGLTRQSDLIVACSADGSRGELYQGLSESNADDGTTTHAHGYCIQTSQMTGYGFYHTSVYQWHCIQAKW